MPITNFKTDTIDQLGIRRARRLIIAGIFIAGAVAWIAERDGGDEQVAEGLAKPAAKNAIGAELARCQALGESGSRDGFCLRVWAENRRRFFVPTAQPMARTPEPPQTKGNSSPPLPSRGD